MKNYSDIHYEYYKNDFINPKISTKKFFAFLERNKIFQKEIENNSLVLDMGTGSGSGLYYFAKRLSNIQFVGVDYDKRVLDIGEKHIYNIEGSFLKNLKLLEGDWNKPKEIIKNIQNQRIKLLTSVHSLCTQKVFLEAASALAGLNPEYLAFNSLFYDGPMDVLIHIRSNEYLMEDSNPDADFNIHSLPNAIKDMNKLGYSLVADQVFEIDSKLEKPKGNKRGTYTMKTELSDFTQFSGPVYLPWRFLLFQKS